MGRDRLMITGDPISGRCNGSAAGVVAGVGPGGTIVYDSGGGGVTWDSIPSSTDEWDGSTDLLVVDMANPASTAEFFVTGRTTPGDSQLIVDPFANAPNITGTDLTWDGSQLLTAAGGTFLITLGVRGQWD